MVTGGASAMTPKMIALSWWTEWTDIHDQKTAMNTPNDNTSGSAQSKDSIDEAQVSNMISEIETSGDAVAVAGQYVGVAQAVYRRRPRRMLLPAARAGRLAGCYVLSAAATPG
jgi:hypothetical protein